MTVMKILPINVLMVVVEFHNQNVHPSQVVLQVMFFALTRPVLNRLNPVKMMKNSQNVHLIKCSNAKINNVSINLTTVLQELHVRLLTVSYALIKHVQPLNYNVEHLMYVTKESIFVLDSNVLQILKIVQNKLLVPLDMQDVMIIHVKEIVKILPL